MGPKIRLNITPVKGAYYLFLAVVGLVGILLLYLSATHFSQVEGRDREKMVHDLEHIRPGFTVVQSDSIRSLLKARDPLLSEETFGDALRRDLGIALIVAVILTVSIEFYARSRLQEEVRSGVIDAAFRRLISPLVFSQVKGHVIEAKSLKRSWTVEMVIHSFGSAGGDGNLYLSRTVLSYVLESLTGGVEEESVLIELDRDLTIYA